MVGTLIGRRVGRIQPVDIGQQDQCIGHDKLRNSGGKSVNLFGRNEGGGQRFHGFVDELLATEDDDLAALFKNAAS